MWPWKEVGLIRAWQMKSHVFSTLCNDLDCEHGGLLCIPTRISYQKYMSIFRKCSERQVTFLNFYLNYHMNVLLKHHMKVKPHLTGYLHFWYFLWINKLDLVEHRKSATVYNTAGKKIALFISFNSMLKEKIALKLLWHI